jgi:glycerol-3-phosphate dehydrogenase subunit B
LLDVLVVGAGMAGTVSALACKQAGLRVGVCSRGYGATALSSGALDIAYSPALSPALHPPRTLAEHVMDIIAHRRRHPYAVLGFEAAVAGIRRGAALLDLALDLEAENLLLPAALGALVPAAGALAVHSSAVSAGTWAVLQFIGDGRFDACRVARGIEEDARALDIDIRTRVVAVSVPTTEAFALADAFDHGLAQALLPALGRAVEGCDGLVAAPVLGAAAATLQAALGIPVCEALSQVPSVPGLRLQRRLDARRSELPAYGAALAPLGALKGIVTASGDVPARAVILATGRFIGGGIRFAGGCRETLFDLPVASEIGPLEDDHPLPIVRALPTESHPLMTAGLWVDDAMRPLREGHVAYPNLFAAGTVIGGFASRYALCADGVALATAIRAAEGAVAVCHG